MKNVLNKMLGTSIVASILFIAMGIFLFLKPETTISTISYFIGAIILFLGSFSFFRFFTAKEERKKFSMDLVYGILSFVSGLILIINPTALATIIQYVVGVWIIINSAVKIQYAYNLKNENNKAFISALIISLISLIWGIVLVLYPFKGALLVTKMIGVFLVVYAVLDIVDCIIIKINMKKIVKEERGLTIIDAREVK